MAWRWVSIRSPPRRAQRAAADCLRRLAAQGDGVDGDGAAEAEMRVEAGSPGRAERRFVGQVDRADAMAAAQLPRQPGRDELLLTGLATGQRRRDGQCADADAALAAADAPAGVDRHRRPIDEADAAAEERQQITRAAGAGLVADGEGALVLEEELALLRKYRADAGQVDLLLVDLDLRVVGAEGQIPGQVAPAVLDVEAGVAVAVPVAHAADEGRFDAQAAAGADVIDALEHAGVRDLPLGELARHRRPHRDLVAPAQDTDDVEPPPLPITVWEAERAERDRHLHRPAAVDAPGPHRPDAVPVLIQLTAVVMSLARR